MQFLKTYNIKQVNLKKIVSISTSKWNSNMQLEKNHLNLNE